VDTQEKVLKRIGRYQATVGNEVKIRTGERIRQPISWWGQGIGFPRKGNRITPLIDGEAYFAELFREMEQAQQYILITGYVLSASFKLRRRRDPAAEKRKDYDYSISSLDREYSLEEVIRRITQRSVEVRIVLWGLNSQNGAWRPPPPTLSPIIDAAIVRFMNTREEQRVLQDAGARVAVYSKSKFLAGLHQKSVVIDGRIAYCGGLDIAFDSDGDRWDTPEHRGDASRRAKGSRGWHDVQLRLEGPVVADVQENFARRWRLERGRNLDIKLQRGSWTSGEDLGVEAQVIRTIPGQKSQMYGHPPDSADYSTIESWAKAIINAKDFIYIENQYFFCSPLIFLLAQRLRRNPRLHLIVLVPKDFERTAIGGDILVGGMRPATAQSILWKSAPDRVFFGYPTSDTGHDVYVHAKLLIVDDIYATVGSANFSVRAMLTHEEELGIAWIDLRGTSIRDFRRDLWREHLAMTLEELRDFEGSSSDTGRQLFRAWALSNSNRMKEKVWVAPRNRGLPVL
jgi:phosphatidylserine/phosphatidylglycerophosphate/cardiolipin synthase-like enzyme